MDSALGERASNQLEIAVCNHDSTLQSTNIGDDQSDDLRLGDANQYLEKQMLPSAATA